MRSVAQYNSPVGIDDAVKSRCGIRENSRLSLLTRVILRTPSPLWPQRTSGRRPISGPQQGGGVRSPEGPRRLAEGE